MASGGDLVLNSGEKLGANTPAAADHQGEPRGADGCVRTRRFCGNFREHTKADSDSLGS